MYIIVYKYNIKREITEFTQDINYQGEGLNMVMLLKYNE